MNVNIIGTIQSFKLMQLKPNYSALSRAYGTDRHTLSKMWNSENGVILHKKKPSKYDTYKQEIEDLLKIPGVTLKGVQLFLKNKYGEHIKYEALKKYVQTNKLWSKETSIAHPLYETDFGDMVQVDWVENITLHYVNGDPILFNLFSATLAASRLHYFEYTEFKTEVDFKRCLVHYFKFIGGTPKRILTDNMSAIVHVRNNDKIKHQSVIQFEKDIGVPIQLCKVRTPQTKGKDEVSNKYAQWLKPYDYKIKDKADLLRIIRQLNIDCNKQVNTATNMPPVILFNQKEKQTLRPLPNNTILNYYERALTSCKVPATSLITYEGSKYSVPPNYINKIVRYIVIQKILYVYYQNDFIAKHNISARGTVNYKKEDYMLCLAGKFKNQDDIEKTANENLARFKTFGGNYE